MTTDPYSKEDLLQRVSDLESGVDREGRRHRAGDRNSAALISIPLSAYADHKINLYWRIRREGRVVTVRETTLNGPLPVYSEFVAVRAGSYQIDVIARDITTGKIAKESIDFEVK